MKEIGIAVLGLFVVASTAWAFVAPALPHAARFGRIVRIVVPQPRGAVAPKVEANPQPRAEAAPQPAAEEDEASADDAGCM